MENGSPHARYAVVTDAGDEYHIDLIAVAYDWGAAADEACRNGFPDWFDWVRTGRTGKLGSWRPRQPHDEHRRNLRVVIP